MLRLIRMHTKTVERYCEWENTVEYEENVILEWVIGNFKGLKDIEKYLHDFHKYANFDVEDYRKMIITIGDTGHCYIPVYYDEKTVDGCRVRYYVETI